MTAAAAAAAAAVALDTTCGVPIKVVARSSATTFYGIDCKRDHGLILPVWSSFLVRPGACSREHSWSLAACLVQRPEENSRKISRAKQGGDSERSHPVHEHLSRHEGKQELGHSATPKLKTGMVAPSEDRTSATRLSRLGPSGGM